ncbi:hypothetical protein OBBRIDRAFT_891584 [Obba rivulosa]|uniref:DUF6533 domain-containing protein n=1 Tax=Obba rivulosa TaxID=1052685 RepID=A0A8E2AM54_9APHY|nr:hypothetical protein OBBRIDRAFT_891584 [Obba rivulosa]
MRNATVHDVQLSTLDKISYAEVLQSQESARSVVAALCLLLYDILLTTRHEIEHIWLTPWARTKVLYFFIRYYPLFALILLNAHSMSCQEWILVEGISALLLEIAVELTLILRINAMYGGRRKLMKLMMSVFLLQIVVMAAGLGFGVPKIMSRELCVETALPVGLVLYSVVSIAYETFLFGLTIARYVKAMHDGWSDVILLAVLVRDGAWAFAIIFIIMVVNALLFTIAPATLAAIGFPWLLALLGAVGPRLITNLRAQSKTNSMPSSASQIDFAIPTDLYAPIDPDDLEP